MNQADVTVNMPVHCKGSWNFPPFPQFDGTVWSVSVGTVVIRADDAVLALGGATLIAVPLELVEPKGG